MGERKGYGGMPSLWDIVKPSWKKMMGGAFWAAPELLGLTIIAISTAYDYLIPKSGIHHLTSSERTDGYTWKKGCIIFLLGSSAVCLSCTTLVVLDRLLSR